jgi:hypothetical protein
MIDVVDVRCTSGRKIPSSAKYGPFLNWIPLTSSGIRKPRRKIVEAIDASGVGGRVPLARARDEIDHDAGKRGTGLIEHPAAHTTGRLGVCRCGKE